MTLCILDKTSVLLGEACTHSLGNCWLLLQGGGLRGTYCHPLLKPAPAPPADKIFLPLIICPSCSSLLSRLYHAIQALDFCHSRSLGDLSYACICNCVEVPETRHQSWINLHVLAVIWSENEIKIRKHVYVWLTRLILLHKSWFQIVFDSFMCKYIILPLGGGGGTGQMDVKQSWLTGCGVRNNLYLFTV